jgi:hypothetical protein
VTDEGGETRSASRSFRLGRVAVEAALRLPAAFLRAGEAAEVSFVSPAWSSARTRLGS